MNRYLLVIPVILLALYGAQQYHSRTLAGARKVAAGAVRTAQEALDSARVWEERAKVAEARRKAAAPARAIVVAAAPDTCAPAIAALEADKADLLEELDAQKQAAALLRPATVELTEATTALVKSTGGFWKAITPSIGVGVAAIYDPFQGRPAIGPGITLSWEF
jgi:hypothetical protein